MCVEGVADTRLYGWAVAARSGHRQRGDSNLRRRLLATHTYGYERYILLRVVPTGLYV